jgi:hypothetical protein
MPVTVKPAEEVSSCLSCGVANFRSGAAYRAEPTPIFALVIGTGIPAVVNLCGACIAQVRLPDQPEPLRCLFCHDVVTREGCPKPDCLAAAERALARVSAEVDEPQPRVVWFLGHPWRLVQTGGGCTGYQHDNPDGSYVLLTRENDASAPDAGERSYLYGYDSEGNEAGTACAYLTGASHSEHATFDPTPATVFAYVAGGNQGGDCDGEGEPVVDGLIYVAVGTPDGEAHTVSPGFETHTQALGWARRNEWIGREDVLPL